MPLALLVLLHTDRDCYILNSFMIYYCLQWSVGWASEKASSHKKIELWGRVGMVL